MSSIDPRLYGTLPHPQPHHQQHHPPLHHSLYNSPTQFQRLPHIHQVQGLPNTLPPPQQSYYRPPPQYTSPTLPLNHLRDSRDNSSTASPLAHETYREDISSPNGANGHVDGDPNDPKRSRACEACRNLKVRCDPDPEDLTRPCKRCAKAKRQCIITAPSRKRQKKTDSRVAELEKKVEALTASLNAKEKDTPETPGRGLESGGKIQPSPPVAMIYGATPMTHPSPTNGRQRSTWKEERETFAPSPIVLPPIMNFKRQRSDEMKDDGVLSPKKGLESAKSVEIDTPTLGHAGIDAHIDDIIDQATATRIFDHYVTDMVQTFPAVTFDPGATAADVRSSKPILFLAILVAASVGETDLKLQQRLAQYLMNVFADCIIRNGVKSLELVQAMMVSCIWYRPPKRYDQMNFYQLTHIAAVMAIDVGMGKRFNRARRSQADQAKNARSQQAADSPEVRRTWLGCYFLCANTSMTLRRPNFIRWNNYTKDCIEILETSPEALPSDKVLCQHIKLQHINEEIGEEFSMDDPSASITISDSRVHNSIKTFEGKLDEWNRAVPKRLFDSKLEFSQHVAGLYAHEVAMHSNHHNIDDFRAPFTEESIKAASGQSEVLSPAHSAALRECLTSIHGMFDTFFSFDERTIRTLPVFYFVRVAYALVALIKFFFAVIAHNSEVGKVITREALRVEHYVDELLAIFLQVDKKNAFRPASKFLIILGKLSEWFHNEENKAAAMRDIKAEAPQLQRQLQQKQQIKAQQQQKAQHEQAQQQQAQAQAQQQHQARIDQYQQAQQAAQQQHQQAAHHHHHHQSQQQHQQHQAQHTQHRYTNTPLHFLSEVATNNANPNPNATPSMQQPQAQTQTQNSAHNNIWYNTVQSPPLPPQPPQQPHNRPLPTHLGPLIHSQPRDLNPNRPLPLSGYVTSIDLDTSEPHNANQNHKFLSTGFESAMDMALGPGAADGDISSFFMGDPLFNFGMEGFGGGGGLEVGDGGLELDPNGMYGLGW